MPVDVKHQEYEAAQMVWDRIRNVIAGEDAVKDQGTLYLPQLGGQEGADLSFNRSQ